ncbi:uncharacterized protein LOC143867347 [Tasmannia lanceolata]|uniref:uncharacterized protein LOC143867347 n=1 Tax=Tasmannia lanceolata TaxID=3420 RepID=UPI00406294D6
MATRIKVRKFCLLLSYCGKNYQGMQRNPGTNTVEEFLLSALKETTLIPEDHYHRPQLMYFQRAARTDKSVSAIKQIVSMKLAESIQIRIDDINKLLPTDIRLMGCRRVTQSFDAKNYCDARTYSYMMPSLALCPLSEVTTDSYRAPKEVIDLFNSTLEGYLGTHIFHNFTSGKKFNEDSSARVIKSIGCSEPFYPCNQDKLEFVVVRIKGQSFMLHQIRKMIGLAIAVVKGYATEDHIKRSMEEGFMDVPKAPGVGLMLEEVHFERYNRRYGGDGQHDPIDWETENDQIEKFKQEYIYPVIVETEMNDKSMLNWLHTLSLHSYGDGDRRNHPTFRAAIQAGDDKLYQANVAQNIKRSHDGGDSACKRTKIEESDETKQDDLTRNNEEVEEVKSS